MPRRSSHASTLLLVLAVSFLCGLLTPWRAAAQVAHQGTGPLSGLVVVDARLRPDPATAQFGEVQSMLPAEVRNGWAGFLADAGGTPTPAQTVDRRQALQALSAYVGGFGAADTFLDGGSLPSTRPFKEEPLS